MPTLTTQSVRVSVETMYQPHYSKPFNYEFVHAYRITIENFNDFPIQLLQRFWSIWDSNDMTRQIEGEGVVGKQPILEPQNSFQYVSACPLQTEIGNMRGHYLMKNIWTNEAFKVEIPVFELVAQHKYN
jgi:ApaG protein